MYLFMAGDYFTAAAQFRVFSGRRRRGLGVGVGVGMGGNRGDTVMRIGMEEKQIEGRRAF